MKRSDYKFGLSDERWNDVKAQLRTAIMDAAWDRRMTSYGEIAEAGDGRAR